MGLEFAACTILMFQVHNKAKKLKKNELAEGVEIEIEG